MSIVALLALLLFLPTAALIALSLFNAEEALVRAERVEGKLKS